MRRSIIAAMVPVLLASCVAPRASAPVAPSVPVTVAPPPPASVAPPATPAAVASGDWRYSNGAARFEPVPGSVMVSIECTSGRAVLVRAIRASAAASGPATLTLRASTTAKSYGASGDGAFATARLAASDPMLDAAAFSRGSFAIAVDGVERRVPAWPEVARVVEDCRA